MCKLCDTIYKLEEYEEGHWKLPEEFKEITNSIVYDEDDKICLYHECEDDYYSDAYMYINYCPKCGRNLKTNKEAENHPMTEDEFMTILKDFIKKHRDSLIDAIELYRDSLIQKMLKDTNDRYKDQYKSDHITIYGDKIGTIKETVDDIIKIIGRDNK